MSCNICEVETILSCPDCESLAAYDTGSRESGVLTCTECSCEFQWIADHKLVMESGRPVGFYWPDDDQIADIISGNLRKEPAHEPVDCPACKSVTMTKGVYQFHHDFNWETCSECSYRFPVVCHGVLRFYTYPVGDVSAESAVIKGDFGEAEAQAACM